MQPICVLRHDSDQMSRGLHRRERIVPSIGSGGQRDRASLLRHPPVGCGVGEKAVDGGDLHRVVLRPQAALAAKSRDPALRRDARSRERNCVMRRRKKRRSPFHHQAKTDCIAWPASNVQAVTPVGARVTTNSPDHEFPHVARPTQSRTISPLW